MPGNPGIRIPGGIPGIPGAVILPDLKAAAEIFETTN